MGLVGATGSARELVGACLGTEQVYNEISAHAAGATHFAADVDTIFEIGGQDAKYIYLRNGVPIGYAMNNACSAGTGSFLEESAQSDLGIGVSEIADIAIAAPAPVKFKTTCAAFINSDIRIAQQQGQKRDNILAGLVYAIADNYLTKVKGQRPVGKKVLLQGGVALNRAVGYAFAQRVGRPIVIPANPELLGALGVGLLALDRAGGVLGTATDLETLAVGRDETRGPIHMPGVQDVLQHRALRGGWAEVSLRRPLQPVRERVEEKVPHRACPGPGGTARRDRLWCSQTCRHRTSSGTENARLLGRWPGT